MAEGSSGRTLRLDLHVHLCEALQHRMPDLETARLLLAKLKEARLDGIAIVDHTDGEDSFKLAERLTETAEGKAIFIPGRELRRHLEHVVELFLEDGLVYRFVAHPGRVLEYHEDFFADLHGIEWRNGNWHVDEETIKEASHRYGLMLLQNSDAHSLADIGSCANQVSVEELQKRARKSLQ